MKKVICILVCTLLIATAIPVMGKNILTQKSEVLSSKYLIIKLQSEDYTIKTSENNYVEILMDDFGSVITPGEPTLPSKTFYVGLPPGGKVVSTEIINMNSEEINGFYKVQPGLPIDGQDIGINTEIYDSNDPYPTNTFDYIGMSQMRKYSLAMIRFSPITYYPTSGKLVLCNSITIKINYEITETIPDVLLSDTAMDDIASDFIYNYNSIVDYYSASQPNRQTHDYVIITTSSLVTSLTGFLNWKTSVGYNVNIVTLTWILANYPATDTQKSIRDFLVANYASWGIKYVLIVGTHASIPMRTCYPDPSNHAPDGIHDIPTDYYYADLTGNWDSDGDGFYGERGQDSLDFVPELFVGRIPTDGSGAVSSITLKIQQFEQTQYTGWKKNAMLLGAIYTYANEDNNPQNLRWDGADVMEQCKNNLLSGFSITTMYEKQGLSPCTYSCTFGLSNSNLTSQWGSSTGWGILNWAAHGLPTSANQKVWSTDDGDLAPENNGEIIWPIMIQNSDNGLLNNAKPPIVFAASCFVSHPESANLGIALLVSGASAFVGASRTSWGSMGWTQPSHGGHGTYCYDFTDRIANKDEDCGHSLFNAKQYVYNNYPWNLWQDNANMYNFNLYGDPSMGMNLPPLTPTQPSGPTTGIAGIQYTYSATGFDPTGDKIKYGWDWNGDGTVDQWDDNNGNYYVTGQPCSTPHTFNTVGTYNVKVKLEDQYGGQSGFSVPLVVVITQNQAPAKPAKPSGTTSGKIGTSYPYTTSSTDPEGYGLAYGWDWNGDGTVDQWDDNGGSYYPPGQTITTSHTWSTKGTYNIKVKAKDIQGNEGPWSDPLTVTMPRYRQVLGFRMFCILKMVLSR